jgi:hypothetical protein
LASDRGKIKEKKFREKKKNREEEKKLKIK